MKTTIVLVHNSSENVLTVVLEPYVHLFPVPPGLTLEVHVEDQPDNEPIEVEYNINEITIYGGGIMTAWANGKELDPQFR